MKRIWFLLVLWAAKVVAKLTPVFFPGRGSNISGRIACRLLPDFLRHVKGIDPQKTVFITGTNGKSTTNNLLVHTFRTAGRTVATNLEGANLVPGVATTCIKNTTMGGRLTAEYLLLEVDERNLPLLYPVIPARYIGVTNIQKDQVQRNGDPDYIYRKIAGVINPDTVLFVNNEEPRSKSLASLAGRALSFGVCANARFSQKEPDIGVTLPCPLCHDALTFSHYNIANVGPFSCPTCGFASDVAPDYGIEAVDYDAATFAIRGLPFHMGYKAAHFLYNYILCYAVAAEMGLAPQQIQAAFASFENLGGRFDSFTYRGKMVHYMRMKQENPETLQNALDTIAADPAPKVFMFGLDVVHDIVPNYTNTFYAYDCNFAPLAGANLDSCICFGQTVCYDVANRLRYADVPPDKIAVFPQDGVDELMRKMDEANCPSVYLIAPIKVYDDMRAFARRAAQ